MTLLDEALADPSAKAVVFSQWLGTHELIVRWLGKGPEQLPWGHVLFSGEVPGDRRGELVECFHRDPDCRLFLSTDAGGVGLNLQHAAALVINMDLPWNPAVLEQRIGRVHRMGQRRGVQVVHFIGPGSIEEGMLSVLAFKKSLFAGVLDGGAGEVFLGGTRLSQFMRSVGEVTASMGEAEAASTEPADGAAGASTEPADAEAAAAPFVAETAAATAAEATAPWAGEAAPPPALEAAAPTAAEAAAAAAEAIPAPPASGSAASPAPASAPAAAAPHDPWPALLQAGAALLQGLARSGGAPRIEPDPATGAPSLRLPLPDPDTLHSLALALEPWLRR